MCKEVNKVKKLYYIIFISAFALTIFLVKSNIFAEDNYSQDSETQTITNDDSSVSSSDKEITNEEAPDTEETTKTENAENENKENVIYVCPKCGYESDEPGDCPACNIKLEEKKVSTNTDTSEEKSEGEKSSEEKTSEERSNQSSESALESENKTNE